MKVFSANGDPNIFWDPVKGFPFHFLTHEVVTDPGLADFIYLWFPNPTTDGVNSFAEGRMHSKVYAAHRDKYVTWALCDFPRYSLLYGGHKFLLSPMSNSPPDMNCHPMPLHPCEPAYQIAIDTAYTEACRNLPKKYDFCFLGQLDDFPYRKYGGRQWMREVQERLGEDRFFVRSKHLNAVRSKDWLHNHREWMLRVGESRYGFCPIGGGDATMDPRLYWTMQVGAIPIILTDWEYLAFSEVVDWEKLAVFVPAEERLTFDYASLPMEGPEYEEKRRAVMQFWNDYCYYPNCAKALYEQYLEE